MKRKILFIDALRNIREQWVSFVSVIVIAMLAVMMYLGISYSAEALYRHISHYYAQQNYQDLQVVTSALLTAEDTEAIRGLDGVADAEGSAETSARAGKSLRS